MVWNVYLASGRHEGICGHEIENESGAEATIREVPRREALLLYKKPPRQGKARQGRRAVTFWFARVSKTSAYT